MEQTGQTVSRLVQVAVDHPIDGELTYRVPGELAGVVLVGSRVVVPLGRGNKPMLGTVLGFTEEQVEEAGEEKSKPREEVVEEQSELFAEPVKDGEVEPEVHGGGGGKFKEIIEVVGDIHPVPEDLLRLGRWISQYYCTPIGVCLSTMVPAAVKRAVRLPMRVRVTLTEGAKDVEKFLGEHTLSAKGKKLLPELVGVLGGVTGGMVEGELLERMPGLTKEMLRKLADKGVVTLTKQIVWPEVEEELKLAAVADLAGAGGETGAAVVAATPERLVLTEDQQRALAEIEGLLDVSGEAGGGGFAVRLIHGVTGSGKTELYIRAIEKVVAAGKRAIVLVPEISLTPQTVRRFTQRFDRVAVLHSGLRDSQRHLHWHAIATGWAQVIVGARSAVFAPADNIGIIVVDEEHDPSYKQDNAPRYHGRDVAIRRAQMLGIPVLLGSATPALESWINATKNGGAGLLKLPTRPMGILMPRVQVVDMRQQSRERKGLHVLSTTLELQLRQTLQAKRQAILLLNRRGYAHYVMCPRCDWVMMCENCSTTMVVHRTGPADPAQTGNDNKAKHAHLMCHYCLTSMIMPTNCPECKAKLTWLGQGTQRAEDELLRKFPGIRLARMDSDSMNNLHDYQETLRQFGQGELDLLLGTQMISKGLDFPNVQLVGVLNADLAMTMPDFRAAERTFQLICQVAGRSGRPSKGQEGSGERGLVVVQTFQPEEAAIVHACKHDYEGFIATELPHREGLGLPPYGRLARLVFADKNHDKAREVARQIAAAIKGLVEKHGWGVTLQGPMPPPMERLAEEYRWELVLQAPTAGPLQQVLTVLRARQLFARCPVGVAIDVDPVRMM